MDFLRYFFRTKPDLTEPVNGSVLMLISLIAFIFVYYYIRKNPPLDRTKKILLIVFLTDIIVRYTWYFVGKYSGLTESLPLYHCRVTALLSIYYLLTSDKRVSPVIYVWGIFGGVLALAHPGMDPFKFPHFSNTFFYFYHIAILMASYVVFKEQKSYILKCKNKVRLFTFCFNISLYIINLGLNSNYGYMVKSPILTEKLSGMTFYFMLAIVVYDLLIQIIYKITDIRHGQDVSIDELGA
nr:TIGR02206 family membrane protein [uncultured Peptostreptococcus sp.]